MKEMIKKVREEKGGFTLAELLIVVAIVAVLVAIAIPVFTSSLENSQYATDEANARSIYAELSADYLASAGKAQASPGIVDKTSLDTAGTIVVTTNNTSNTYQFNGIGKVTIHLGTATTGTTAGHAPWVEVQRGSNAPVIFGTE